MEIKVKENRGAETKYHFQGMKLGEEKTFCHATTGSVLNCAKRYAKINLLDWKFRCYSGNGYVGIVRVK